MATHVVYAPGWTKHMITVFSSQYMHANSSVVINHSFYQRIQLQQANGHDVIIIWKNWSEVLRDDSGSSIGLEIIVS